MTSDSLRGCYNCAHCAAEPEHAPFAAVNKYDFGCIVVNELNERYGICGANSMMVKLGCTGMMTPCALIDYERRA